MGLVGEISACDVQVPSIIGDELYTASNSEA